MAAAIDKKFGFPNECILPSGWHERKLKFIVRCNTDVLPESTNPDTVIDYIDISAVTENEGIISEQKYIFSESPSRARRIVSSGDIIISTVRTYLRAIAYIDDKYNNYICSTGFAVLSAKKNIIIERFLFYSVYSDNFVSNVEYLSTGISYPAITAGELINIKIFVPPLPLQKYIVAYLDAKCARIDAIAADIRATIEKFNEYKQTVITRAVTKGLDPTAPMKDSGVPWIGEIPETWSVVRLKFLLDDRKDALRVGPFGSAIKSDDWKTEGYAVYTQKNVINNNFNEIETFIDKEKYSELVSFKLNSNEFVITTRGTIGIIALTPGEIHEGIIHPCLIKFSISNKINNNYLIYFFNHTSITREQFILSSNSTTLPVIYSYSLKEIQISLPDLLEQGKIVDYLNAKCAEIDEAIAQQETRLAMLEAYKKSLIYECVTGKREVPTP